MLTELKEKYYPLIKRVYVASSNEKAEQAVQEYLTEYDEVYNAYGAKRGGYYATVKRGRIMVDMCDILITSFNKDYRLLSGKMGDTKAAVKYALEKNKRVINLYE